MHDDETPRSRAPAWLTFLAVYTLLAGLWICHRGRVARQCRQGHVPGQKSGQGGYRLAETIVSGPADTVDAA